MTNAELIKHLQRYGADLPVRVIVENDDDSTPASAPYWVGRNANDGDPFVEVIAK